MREHTWKQGNSKRVEYNLDQSWSSGGVEKQFSSTWILKIEPAEFVWGLALVHEKKSN